VIFSGFPFLLGFLPLALCGYAIVSGRGEASAKAWLIVMSLLFYGIGADAFLPLLVLSVAGNYWLLRQVHGSPLAGQLAGLGVAANLAVLGWFKYWAPDPVTPLGLSFFTFTQIGCLLHHADGDTKPPRAGNYALFAAFFPGLTAGPILNPGEMLPQFARTDAWGLTTDRLAIGLGFFVIGLLKKTVLADPLAAVVASGFAEPAQLTFFSAWQAACFYSLQLYFDFSGYSDMAIGLAWMFGLQFPDNFDQPYRATSVIAYWQRWHMSLTRFLMANIHTPSTMAVLRWRRTHGLPIGRAAQGTAVGFACMIGAPVLMTMALISLWHGAAWTFMAFGALHTLFLLINHLWRVHQLPAPRPIAGVALTYLCVLVACVFFRAPSLSSAGSILAGMAGQHGFDLAPIDLRAVGSIGWLASLYAIVWGAPTTRHIMQGKATSRLAWRPSGRWAVAMGCGATIGLLAAGGTGEFLYFRF
jgi:D-alanyl-lipoteichoic acid acyltransferase DltB (MBOAT superfamily)